MSKHEKIPTTVLSGFMELLPADQILFDQMKATIQTVYERFGFVPLDTPVIERAEVLLAKAGGETEKQIYRFTKGDNDLALRFDLTVPLARYVSKHFGHLTFPFRRYAIGKVYRGERPQKGRFREFYQCDIDIVGHGELGLMSDAEIPSIIYSVFSEFGFRNFTIRINNRKVLNGLFVGLGAAEQAADALRIIDKLDKVGEETVEKELGELGLAPPVVAQVLACTRLRGNDEALIEQLWALNIDNELFARGVEELATVVRAITYLGVPPNNFIVDLSIARGLDYYTGTVYETILNEFPEIGSVCSGGRYDNLAEYYTDEQLPGVGISIGLTRLFYQLKQAGAIQSGPATPTRVLVVPMVADARVPLELASLLRAHNISTEVYFDDVKVKRKLAYANKLGVPYVVIIGEDELAAGTYTLKDMRSGHQEQVDTARLFDIIRAREDIGPGA